MDSTTITTPSPGRERVGRGRRGFTLVELIIASGIGAFVLAAVLTAYGFIVRSGVNLVNYSEMEGQARTALEYFAQDTRQASSIKWNSKQSVTLTVSGSLIVYEFDDSENTFYRRVAGGDRKLLQGIQAFEFKAYNITGTELDLSDLTAADKGTKQLQISLTAARSSQTVARASNTVLSARFILRNKRVTT